MDPRATMIYLIVRELLEVIRVIWIKGIDGLWIAGLIVEVVSIVLIILTLWLMKRKLKKRLMKMKSDVESRTVSIVCCHY